MEDRILENERDKAREKKEADDNMREMVKELLPDEMKKAIEEGYLIGEEATSRMLKDAFYELINRKKSIGKNEIDVIFNFFNEWSKNNPFKFNQR